MKDKYLLKTIRTISPEFNDFRAAVLATWLNSNRYGSAYFKDIDSQSYFQTYSKGLTELLKRPNCMARIAVFASEPDTLIGWAVFEGSILHFLYVKRDARGLGVAWKLYPEQAETITHLTNQGRAIWKKKLNKLKFNPF